MNIRTSLAVLSLFIPSMLLADHAEVGSRENIEEVVIVEQPSPSTEEEGTLETLSYFDYYSPQILYSKAHHWLNAITVLDNGEYTLELEDGSCWKVCQTDGSKALYWKTKDPLTITQNNRWFSKYNYRIINKSNGISIEANLFLGPILLGEHSRYITSINHERGEIMLSDYSHWDVSYGDYSSFKNWAVNDYVILGIDSSSYFWQSPADALLINVNMNNGVRAKQF